MKNVVSEALQFAQERKPKDNLLKKIVFFMIQFQISFVVFNSLKLLQTLTLSKTKQAYVGFSFILTFYYILIVVS